MLQHILIILGPPGSGKGTQGKLLAPLLNYSYISMGQYFREYSKKDTALAHQIKESIDNGRILPDELFEQIFPEVVEIIKHSDGVIFDGFPRDVAQIPVLEKLIQDTGVQDVKAIQIEVPKEKLIERIHTREKVQSRADDEPEIIATRFDEYMQKSLPAIEYFEQKHKLITVDGNHPIEDVHKQIMEKLNLHE